MDKNFEVIKIIDINIRDNLLKHIGGIVEIRSFRMEYGLNISPLPHIDEKIDITFGRLLGITAEGKAVVENLDGLNGHSVPIDLIVDFKVCRERNNETQNSKGDEMDLIDKPSKPIPNRDHILDTAKIIINGERQGTYGHAENSFSTIAKLWTAFLGKDLTAADVANMMILMKVARNASGVYKEDNWVDICGYAALGGEIQGRDY